MSYGCGEAGRSPLSSNVQALGAPIQQIASQNGCVKIERSQNSELRRNARLRG